MNRVLFLALSTFFLFGCVAGPVPIVGYPTGQTPGEKELKEKTILPDGTVQKIYELEIKYNYRLLATPDGGRESSPLKSGYRYFMQNGDLPEKELMFLRSDPAATVDGESLKHLFSLGDGRWLGFAEHKSSTMLFFTLLLNPNSRALHERKYYMVAFSEGKELARLEITSKTELSKPEFNASTRTLKLHAGSAEKHYRFDGAKLIELIDKS